MRRYLNTLIALVVLLALWGTFTFINRRKSKEAAANSTPAAQKIFPIDRSHIESFTLKPQNGEAITCARQGKTWAITTPRKLATDATAVDGFLNSLADASVDETVDEHPTDLKTYGLDPPTETIEIATNSKPRTFTLLLGDSTPTNGGVYAQISGQQRVVTLASYLKSSLEKNLFDLRDKRAVTLKGPQIQRIEVSSGSDKYTLVKNPEGIWDLVLPPAVRADHFTVDGLVDELGNVSMQSIVDESKKNLGKYGFSTPTLTLHLSGPSGNQTLVIGKKQGDQYYAMNSAEDPVFMLGSEILTQFQKKSVDLRSKDLFTFSTFEARKITVDAPEGHQEYVQNKDKWERVAPPHKSEPTDKVQALLDALRDLSATSFPTNNPTNLAAYGLTKPQYTFEVAYGDKNQTQTVQIAKVGSHVYARLSTDLVPSELSQDALKNIDKALNAL